MKGLVLGGLIEVGDEVCLDGHVRRVEEVDGPRVARVSVKMYPTWTWSES